jgi:hypothetical protein
MSDRKTGRKADGTFGPGNSGKPKRHMPLTRKQERFVEEYLIDLNATQVAIRGGLRCSYWPCLFSDNHLGR